MKSNLIFSLTLQSQLLLNKKKTIFSSQTTWNAAQLYCLYFVKNKGFFSFFGSAYFYCQIDVIVFTDDWRTWIGLWDFMFNNFIWVITNRAFWLLASNFNETLSPSRHPYKPIFSFMHPSCEMLTDSFVVVLWARTCLDCAIDGDECDRWWLVFVREGPSRVDSNAFFSNKTLASLRIAEVNFPIFWILSGFFDS